MLKFGIGAILLIFGFKYGVTYLTSEDFQRYGDENKAQWTCRVNNLMGQFYVTMSHYDDALKVFTPVLKRCPKTPMAEEATFRIAICLEETGRRAEAAEVYRRYAAAYKGTERARVAARAAEIITGP